MRKNKTYEQQKKYYDESGQYESLGAIFVYWLNAATRPQHRCRRHSEKATESAKASYWKICTICATKRRSISL